MIDLFVMLGLVILWSINFLDWEEEEGLTNDQ